MMLRVLTKAATAFNTSEAELLLGCARTSVDAEQAERIRELVQQDVDWSLVIRTAHAHGVIPLLYQSLQATCADAVPKPAMDQLRDRFRANARRNMVLTRELLALLDLLETHGIPVVPFKGPALAASIYGDLALRQFDDLDVLVRQRHLSRAKDLLIGHGYRLTVHLTPSQEAAYLQSHKDYGFVRERGKVLIELHWRFSRRRDIVPLDPERLWERLGTIALAGTPVSTLAPDDLLLVLCVHAAKHLWERLEWICDIAELIRVHQGMNWTSVIEQARGIGSAHTLFVSLLLAHDLLEAALPEDVLQQVNADPVVASLTAQVLSWLFTEANGPHWAFQRPFFYVMLRERCQDKILYLPHYLGYLLRSLRRIVTPNVKDRALLPLPTYLFPLYYFLRPVRLLRDYGLNRSKRLRGW